MSFRQELLKLSNERVRELRVETDKIKDQLTKTEYGFAYEDRTYRLNELNTLLNFNLEVSKSLKEIRDFRF